MLLLIILTYLVINIKTIHEYEDFVVSFDFSYLTCGCIVSRNQCNCWLYFQLS
jgi:hypothetical protein